jgi:sugar phosphate isomerase/epimerase
MGPISRRQAGKVLLAGSAGLLASRQRMFGQEKIDSVIRGVQIGAQSYSFRDRPLEACLEGFREVGLGECELWQGHVEPRNMKGAELKNWRLTAPFSHFHEIREKFDRAGILLYAYNFSFRREMTEAEIERGFEIAKALGVGQITASATVSVAPRVDKAAQKYQIVVGFHGHDQTNLPDEFSTAETFARALEGASNYLAVNLDVGHFVAAGGDPVAYMRQNHERINVLHLKDRKKNHGANLPFGEGDTPIVEVLRLLRDEGWKIPANIEYEYGEEKAGLDTIAEVKKCFAYCRKALET